MLNISAGARLLAAIETAESLREITPRVFTETKAAMRAELQDNDGRVIHWALGDPEIRARVAQFIARQYPPAREDGAGFCLHCGTRCDGDGICPRCKVAETMEHGACPECGSDLGTDSCPDCGIQSPAGRSFKVREMLENTGYDTSFDDGGAETDLSDMLADAMHFAEAEGLVWDVVVDRAMNHYTEERLPECSCSPDFDPACSMHGTLNRCRCGEPAIYVNPAGQGVCRSHYQPEPPETPRPMSVHEANGDLDG